MGPILPPVSSKIERSLRSLGWIHRPDPDSDLYSWGSARYARSPGSTSRIPIPSSLLEIRSLRSLTQLSGHFYFAQKGTFLLCVDSSANTSPRLAWSHSSKPFWSYAVKEAVLDTGWYGGSK